MVDFVCLVVSVWVVGELFFDECVYWFEFVFDVLGMVVGDVIFEWDVVVVLLNDCGGMKGVFEMVWVVLVFNMVDDEWLVEMVVEIVGWFGEYFCVDCVVVILFVVDELVVGFYWFVMMLWDDICEVIIWWFCGLLVCWVWVWWGGIWGCWFFCWICGCCWIGC